MSPRPDGEAVSEELRRISRTLSDRVSRLKFAEPVTHTYNPLAYARRPHEEYLARYGRGPKEVVLLGMNPGPFGMAQTGVPFGDVAMVRDWLGVEAEVSRPKLMHDKRPVLGFACARGEVSGQRLWGWARQRFGAPEAFFSRFFVVNYCPLAFIEVTGKNRTPDKLPASERAPLFAACDQALRDIVQLLRPRHVVGIGAFALARAGEALAGHDVSISTILHPSPQSPLANSGWAPRIEAQLAEAGIAL
ncbi:MAG TPA: uracil-DNA glycosylase family protein [Polyangiaceae bacterium]|nr:uracil-DNA glycosylase family protein [Polyangiaceae bacterium]